MRRREKRKRQENVEQEGADCWKKKVVAFTLDTKTEWRSKGTEIKEMQDRGSEKKRETKKTRESRVRGC